ncbi:hypothetical protein FEA48_30530 [Pseudomonas nitroreducens]|uniref:Uncharacterized protein n=1 Tax=Pseudomonas nitroreducens TaxID=46680 RepID=A0A5R8ZQ17_PSENT|nr:hypothetical protein [Pseudomonas nitroreducens]TLP68195.1 hypothetical protein FEA48_30530 [Pseudomonas nitroreducens]
MHNRRSQDLLDEMIHGTHLNENPDHDDDGLRAIADYLDDDWARSRLFRHIGRAEQVLQRQRRQDQQDPELLRGLPRAPEERLAFLVSDDDLAKAFKNTNFGDKQPRAVLRLAVLKCATGYHQGHTSMTIARELGLLDPEIYALSARGRLYLWEAFSAGSEF